MKPVFFSKNISWQSLLSALTEVNYLAIIFLTPLWFAYFFPTYNMFEFNKSMLFQILVWNLFFLTAWRLILLKPQFFCWKNYKNKLNWLKKYFAIPAVLVLGLALTLPFSVDSARSFFGSIERQQGLVSYFYYFLWALLVFINLSLLEGNFLKQRLRRLVRTVFLTGLAVAIYGILQILNIDFFNWPEPPYLTGRAMSTLGQPNFLASFLLLTIPLSIYLAYSAKNFLTRSFFGIAILLQISCLFFTSSRGGLLAFLFTLTLATIILMLASRLAKKWKIAIIAIIVFVGLSGLAAMEFVTPGRIKESFDLKRGSLAARVFFFQAAADAVWQKPIFGYGLENGAEIFIKYYERDWALYGQVSANADRAHNLILDVLITSGFFGLALFCAWYYAVFRLGWQESRSGEDRALSLAILLALAGYIFSLFFSFTIVAGEVYFWLFFSILAIISFRPEQGVVGDYEQEQIPGNKAVPPAKQLPLHFFWRSLAVIVVFILVAWQIERGLNALLADYYQNEMHIAIGKQNFAYAGALHQQALSLKVNSVQKKQINYFFGNSLSTYCEYGSFKDAAEEEALKRKTGEILDSLPDTSYQYLFLKAKLFGCLQDTAQAEYYFSRMAEISPDWPLGHLARGHHFFLQGNLEEAVKYYKLADINLPDINSPLINAEHRQAVINYKFLMYNSLGEGYFQRGEYRQAEKFFDAAYRHRPEEYPLLKKIADCHYLRGDLEGALKYVWRGLQTSPGDYNWPLALAVLYFEKGDAGEAVRQLEAALDLAPESEQGRISELLDIYRTKQ